MRNPVKNLFGPARAKRLNGFGRDARGVAAIEFAMIAPLMIMMFIGAVEFSQAITVDRRVSQVASSTGDLIARTKTITTSEMEGVMEVVEQLVKPYDHTLLKLSVMNVTASPTDETDTKICWAFAHNGGVDTYAAGQPFTLPTGVVQKGESVIVTEVEYDYTPLIFDRFITTTKTLEETFYLKPRLSSYVKFNSTDC